MTVPTYSGNNQVEEWRTIEEFPSYEVSSFGNIRNKKTPDRYHSLNVSGRGRNYYSVTFSVNNVQTRRNVHRLVAKAFIPNPNNLPEINHKDENGLNNRVENLEWCDRRYNLMWGNRTQKFIDAKSIPILQCDKLGNVIKEWKSQTEAAKELHLDTGSLSHALAGWRINQKGKVPVYTYHGFIWKYKNPNKLGHYDEELGGLSSPTTNQRLYKINHLGDGDYTQEDITYKLTKKI